VAIAEDCVIEDSVVGPHTSIGRGSKVKASSIEHCVLLEGSELDGVERLEDSLVGKHCKVSQDVRNRRTLKVHLGDYSEVVL
jgi:glucose-1-phosphate thymidylyltransferase